MILCHSCVWERQNKGTLTNKQQCSPENFKKRNFRERNEARNSKTEKNSQKEVPTGIRNYD